MKIRRDPFQAIADPVRRDILDLLSQNPLNVKAVAENFDISRPAVSKHLRILEECGLVSIEQQGRERFYHARLQELQEVGRWVAKYQVFWTRHLDALEKILRENDTNTP